MSGPSPPPSFFSHPSSQVNLNPESIPSRGTIVLSIKFIPDGFEGQPSTHIISARHALLDSRAAQVPCVCLKVAVCL